MAKYKIIPSSRTIVQSPISIGHKAEKGVEAIEFDLTAWVETYGSGTLTVIMRRWGDAIPYPIALEIDENNKATWTLSDTDTAKAGMAYAQLSYVVGETVVKKSDIYTFRVMDSLTGEGDPPEAYESWLEHLTHLAAEAMAEVLDIEGIVTDKTLTVDGGIADAKATGDALALKADKSTTYTKTEVDQMVEDVEVETDTTLEIAGAPADAAETGRQIGLIKADLTTLADITPIPDNSDLNDYIKTGLYSIENLNYTILHYPDSDENKSAATLEVKALTNGYIQQVMTKGAGRMFARVRFGNGNWQNWVHITRNTEVEFPFNAKEELIACLKHVAWKDSEGESHFDNLALLLNVLNIETLIATRKRVNVILLSDNQYDTKYNIYSGQDNTRAMMYAPSGTRSIVSDNGTATQYYPIKIPADIRKIWFDGAKENEYAVNAHVMYYDSTLGAFRRVLKDEYFSRENGIWKYDNLDGGIWKLDISDVNDGNLYMIGMFAKSHSSRTYTDSNGNQHTAANLDGTEIDSNVNKIVLKMV